MEFMFFMYDGMFASTNNDFHVFFSENIILIFLQGRGASQVDCTGRHEQRPQTQVPHDREGQSQCPHPDL